MNTASLPHPLRPKLSESRPSAGDRFLTPHFDTQAQGDSLRITVWVPEVQASGVEIATQGGELTVTAAKPQVVRSNWRALHLESAQRDYQITLRLGRSWDLTNLKAAINQGVLTIDLPLRRLQQPDTLTPTPRRTAA